MQTRAFAEVATHVLWILLICVQGCRSDEDRRPPGGHEPTTLIVGRPASSMSLDPPRVTDKESVEICEQIYEGLLRYRAGTNEVEPALAESWEVSEDGRTWDFSLRRGVTFHDGSLFDAKAAAFSILRAIDSAHPYHRPDSSALAFAWTATYKNIQRVEALSSHRLRIVIERQYAPFAANLAMFPIAIVSPTAVKKWGAEYHRHPVGTGPFRFVSWSGGRTVLERNLDYWGTLPDLERLVFRTISDGRQRLIALESRAIDLAYSVPPDQLQFVVMHPQLTLHRVGLNNVSYLALNTQRGPTKDVRVRQAINHAINREPIVKLAYQGMAIAADGPLHPGHAYRSAGSFDYDFDLNMARVLLDEAIADGTFSPEEELRLYVSSTPRLYLPNPLMVARIVKANLLAIGLKVVIIEQGFHEHLLSVRNGQHDLCLLGWVEDNADPDNYLYVLFDGDNASLGSARNVAFLNDSALHQLLIGGQKVQDFGTRLALYRSAQSRIGELAPWVPLVHAQLAIASWRDLERMTIAPSGLVVFRDLKR